ESVVPNLQGVLEADARNNANAAHIAILVAAHEPNAEVKPGTVIRQSVPAGQHVPREYPVGIVIADEVPKVPSVAQLSVEDATKRLQERGYAIQVGETIPSADIAKGLVIDQTPKADTPQAKGSTVTVRLSAGAGDVELPKVIGVPLTKAKEDLEKLGV